METPTVFVCRCIPEARGTIPLFQARFTMQYTDGTPTNSNRQCVPKARVTVPHPDTVQYAVHRQKHRRSVSYRQCIPKARGTVPLFQELFTMQYTDGNTDGLKLLVYFRGEGNYSTPPDTVHYVVHRQKHRQSKTVGVFQRQGVLFPSPRHCLLCSTPMKTPKDSNLWCIPEVRGIVPILISMMAITKCQVPKRITDGM